MPSAGAIDEVIMVLSLIPAVVTNLKARVDDQISVTDASPSGGGAAVATRFRPPPLMLDVPMDTCYECGREIEAGSAYPCPTELSRIMGRTMSVRDVSGGHQNLVKGMRVSGPHSAMQWPVLRYSRHLTYTLVVTFLPTRVVVSCSS